MSAPVTLQGICRTASKAFHLLRQKRVDPGNLFLLRRPRQAKLESQRQALGFTGRRLEQNSPGQGLGQIRNSPLSFNSVNACNGVLERLRRVQEVVESGASNTINPGWGLDRQK